MSNALFDGGVKCLDTALCSKLWGPVLLVSGYYLSLSVVVLVGNAFLFALSSLVGAIVIGAAVVWLVLGMYRGNLPLAIVGYVTTALALVVCWLLAWLFSIVGGFALDLSTSWIGIVLIVGVAVVYYQKSAPEPAAVVAKPAPHRPRTMPPAPADAAVDVPMDTRE